MQNDDKYCYAFGQLFVNPDGRLGACGVSDVTWYDGHNDDLSDVFGKKRQHQEELASGDLSACKTCGACDALYTRPGYREQVIDRLVIWTNTYCPLACKYCLQAWHSEEDPVPLTKQPKKYIRNFAALLEKILAAPGAENLKHVELLGGDTAFHPEFNEILDLLADHGLLTVYSSSGFVPKKAHEKILERVASGDLHVSVSPDAATAETWGRIARRPAKGFRQVAEFIRSVAEAATTPEQLWIKYILMNPNIEEALEFVATYYEMGVRRFRLSEYRTAQLPQLENVLANHDDVDLLAVPEEIIRWTLDRAHRRFNEFVPDERIVMQLDDLQRFFDGPEIWINEPNMALLDRMPPRRAIARAFLERGEQHFRGGRVAPAERLLMRAKGFSDEFPGTLEADDLGRVLNDLSVVSVERDDYGRAAELIGEALRVAPADEDVRANAAHIVSVVGSLPG